jgi:poly(beta-D-mannuronate) lyase
MRYPGVVLVVGCLVSLAAAGGRAGEGAILPDALAEAVGKAGGGDTVVIRDGTYADRSLVIRCSGAEGRPLTIRAQTPGKVVFTGKSSLEVRGAWVAVEGLVWDRCTVGPFTFRESQNCRLTGCAIVDCNPPDASRIHWIRIAGPTSRDNRIDHCYTSGKTKDGVVLTVEGDDGKMPLGTRIDHNHFKDVIRAVRNGLETIRVGTSGFGQLESHTTVEWNVFENCSGDAEIISSKSCANTYRYNTFLGCDGAVTMRHGHRSTIEGNWFYGQGRRNSAGVRLHGSDHRVFNNYFEGLGQFSVSLPSGQSKFVPTGHEPTVRAVVAHNTVMDPIGPAILIGADRGTQRDTPPTDCAILNNLVSSGAGKLVDEQSLGIVRWAGNLMHARAPAQVGIPPRDGVSLADPKLEPMGRLGAGSPALGAGVAPPFPITEDVDGQPRGQARDIGADQHSSAPVTRKPLQPMEVGPGWRRAANSR